MKKLDIKSIIKDNKDTDYHDEYYRPFEEWNVENAIKQAIKEVLPEILEFMQHDSQFYNSDEEIKQEILKQLDIE